MSHSWLTAAAVLCLLTACFSSSASAQWIAAVYDDAYSKAAHARELQINTARRRYEVVSTPLLEAIADAEREATRVFEEAVGLARARYDERVLPAKLAREEVLQNAREEHRKAMRAFKSKYDQAIFRADEINKRARVEGRTAADRARADLRDQYVSLHNEVRTLQHVAEAAQNRARTSLLREINQNTIALQREIDQVHARVEDSRKKAIESFLKSLNEKTVALQRAAALLRSDADKQREEAFERSLAQSRQEGVPRSKARAQAAKDGRRTKREFLETENARKIFDSLSRYKDICRVDRDGRCGTYRDLTTRGKALARSEAEVAEQGILRTPEVEQLFAALEGYADLCRLREDGRCINHRHLTAKGKARAQEEMAKVRQETLGTEAAKKAFTLLAEAKLLCKPRCAELTKMGRQFVTTTRLEAEREVWNDAAGPDVNYEDLVGRAKSKYSEERMHASMFLDEEERRANQQFEAIERPGRINRDKAIDEASSARELAIAETTAPYKRALKDAEKERDQAIARANREFHDVLDGIRSGKWFAMLWYVYIGD